MNVNLYKFSKEKNSTKRPGNANFVIPGVILSQTSLLSPSIIFDMNYTDTQGKIQYESMRESNYAYIEELGNRYYFITNWIYDGKGLWVAQMEEDTMATHKTTIGNSEQYVLRSAKYKNGNITDTLYNTKGMTIDRRNSIIWGDSITGDVDIRTFGANQKYLIIAGFTDVQFFNDGGPVNVDMIGSESFIAMSPHGLLNLSSFINARDNTSLNELKWVHTLHLLPHEPNLESAQGVDYSVKSLKYHDSVTYPIVSAGTGKAYAALVNKPTTIKTRLYLPRHPQSVEIGDYLNKSAFTKHTLYFPSFGTIELDSDAIYNKTSVRLDFITDCTTGDSLLKVIDDTGEIDKVISQIGSNIAVPLLMDQSGRNMRRIANTVISGTIGGVAGLASTAFGISTQNPYAVMGGISATANTINNTITSDAFLPQNYILKGGGSNSIATLNGKITLTSKFINVCEQDNNRFGRPLCEKRTINTLAKDNSNSGFIICQTPHVHATNMLAEEQTKIESFMESGFFYE